MTEYRKIELQMDEAYKRWQSGELTDHEMQMILKRGYEELLEIDDQKKNTEKESLFQSLFLDLI